MGRLIALLVLVPVAAWGQGTFIDPSRFGDSLWRGEVADEDALAACDEDTASSIHWVLDYDETGEGALAHCPPDGSDWEVYTFGGGGGGSGTVTSVALSVPTGFTISGSPITTSGTFTLGLETQSAGLVFAGPATGDPAAPTFRELAATDIPDLSATYLTGIGGESITDLADVTAVSGNTATVATTSGTLTSGDCAEWDASGNLVSAPCGGGGGDLWEQTSSTNVGLDINTDGDIDTYFEAPNATRLRLTQEAGNGSGRADAASLELRHMNPAGYGATIGVTNAAGDLFVDVISNGTTRQNVLFVEAGSGEVGIGTTAPAALLEVQATTNAFGLWDNTGSSNRIGFGAGNAASFFDSNTDLLVLRSASYAAANTPGTGTEVARFSANGLVVVGYVSAGTCRIYGSLASPPSAPSDCWQYYDTSGAQCLRTGGAWVVLAGAGSCD